MQRQWHPMQFNFQSGSRASGSTLHAHGINLENSRNATGLYLSQKDLPPKKSIRDLRFVVLLKHCFMRLGNLAWQESVNLPFEQAS